MFQVIKRKGKIEQKNKGTQDFPGSPVVKTLRVSTAGGTGSIRGQGTKIRHAAWPKKKGTQPACIFQINY